MKEKNGMNWMVIVKCDGHGKEALARLGELVGNCATLFDSVDLDFVNKCEYITAVPVEIALTIDMREKVVARNPKLKWIITGVDKKGAERLHNECGYSVDVPVYPKEDKVVDTPTQVGLVFKMKYTVDGKTLEATAHTMEEVDKFFGIAEKM